MAVEISLPFDLDPVTGTPQVVTEDIGSRFWSLLAAAVTDTGVDHRDEFALTAVGAIVSTVGRFRVSPGKALVKGFYYELQSDGSGTTLDVPVTTNGSSNSRIWRLFLQLDRTGNKVRLVARAGAPAAPSPQPPTPTQSETTVWEIPLARATQTAGSAVLGAVTVDPERPLTRRYRAGYATVTAAVGGSTSPFISFPAGLFTAAPSVVLTVDGNSAPIATSVGNIDTDQFRIGCRSLTGGTVVDVGVRWYAEQKL